jgi:hypothetical protein
MAARLMAGRPTPGTEDTGGICSGADGAGAIDVGAIGADLAGADTGGARSGGSGRGGAMGSGLSASGVTGVPTPDPDGFGSGSTLSVGPMTSSGPGVASSCADATPPPKAHAAKITQAPRARPISYLLDDTDRAVGDEAPAVGRILHSRPRRARAPA